MTRPLPNYDERLDPVEPESVEDAPNQMWACERCATWTADPMWLQGQIVCQTCAHDAKFKPPTDEPCPF